jgi:hypothetical protein
MALQPFVEPWPLFQFLDLFTQSVGLLGRGNSPSQGRYLHTGQHKQNNRTQTPMPQVEFEPMIPVFERAMTVHALDRVATVIGEVIHCPTEFDHTFQRAHYIYFSALESVKGSTGNTTARSISLLMKYLINYTPKHGCYISVTIFPNPIKEKLYKAKYFLWYNFRRSYVMKLLAPYLQLWVCTLMSSPS